MSAAQFDERSGGGLCLPESRPLEVDVLTSADAFYALEAEWNALLSASAAANVFLTWEWISTWWETFGEGLRPWILTVREKSGGRLAGAAPFVLRSRSLRSGPYRELSLLGSTTAAGDHLDILARVGDQEAVAERVLRALQKDRRTWDVLRLDRIASSSPLARLLRQENTRPELAWESVCPYLQLPERWDDLMTTLRRKFRRNLRKHVRELQEETGNAVEYQQVRSADELPAALEDLFRLHQAVRTARGDRGALHDPAVRRFCTRIAVRLLNRDRLRLYLLKVNGQAIAAACCFRYQDTVCYYLTGYDRAWARYSPGFIINAHAVRRSIEEGAHEFDFLRGTEPYKFRWTNTLRRDLRLRLATTATGSLLVGVYRVLYTARRRFRAWWSTTPGGGDPGQITTSLPRESS